MHIKGFDFFNREKIKLNTVGSMLRTLIGSGANIEHLAAQGKFAAYTYPRNPCIAPLYQQFGNLFGINILSLLQGTGECFQVLRRRYRS